MRDRGYEPGRPRRSPWGICCGGCFGVFALLVVVVALFYAGTGRYQPNLPPPPPMPNPNGLDDYIAAGAMLKATGGTGPMYTNGVNQPPTLAGEQAVVAKNQAALARMRQAFGKECRIPPMRSFSDLFPYLAGTRDLARLLAAEADVKAARGDPAGAFDAGLDSVQMGEDIARGGPLIHGLVSIALQAIANRSLVDNIDRLSARDCDRLADRLQRLLKTRVSFALILQQEKVGMLTSLMSVDAKDVASILPTAQSGDPDETPPSPARRAFGGLAWHFLRDRTLRDMETYMDAFQREVAKPAAARQPVPQPTSPIASILAPVFSQADPKFDETDARNRLILLALKIRSFKLAHGRLPASLGAVGIDPQLRTDPYTGKSLLYKPQGANYVLYSVGPDLKDDGGVPADENFMSGPPRGDIGIRPFRTPWQGGTPGRDYRRVPHMKPPNLPPGAPPLKDGGL